MKCIILDALLNYYSTPLRHFLSSSVQISLHNAAAVERIQFGIFQLDFLFFN